MIFSSGASPAHNAGRRVLPLCIYQIVLTKEFDKYDARRISACNTPLQKGCFGYCAVDRHVSITIIGLVCTPLVLYGKNNNNNGDKFYHRKSMRAADEKLIINKVGSNPVDCSHA